MPCIIVCAVCGLLIVLRMIGGEFQALPGFGGLALLIGTMWFCVNPPHPAFPFVALFVLITLMVSYPFIETELEKREEREYGLERLERSFEALQQKPDSPAAVFEIARWLRHHGYHRDAVALADNALASLGTQRDAVKNVSLRDAFRREEAMVDAWKQEPEVASPSHAHQCPACRHDNEPGSLLCARCGRSYLLDRARLSSFKDRTGFKLIFAYLVIGSAMLAGGFIGLALSGVARYVAIGLAIVIAGGVLAVLLRPPQMADR